MWNHGTANNVLRLRGLLHNWEKSSSILLLFSQSQLYELSAGLKEESQGLTDSQWGDNMVLKIVQSLLIKLIHIAHLRLMNLKGIPKWLFDNFQMLQGC